MSSELSKVDGLKEVYKSRLETDFLNRALSKVIAEEIVRGRQELKVLKRDLTRLEKKYKMPTEKFYQQFQAGSLGDATDFFEWSALYQMYQKSKRRLEILSGRD